MKNIESNIKTDFLKILSGWTSSTIVENGSNIIIQGDKELIIYLMRCISSFEYKYIYEKYDINISIKNNCITFNKN